MFQFNLTLWVIFISFALFMALMKVLFFDKLAWIKQQRELKLEQLRKQAYFCIAECRTLEATYQQELVLIKQEASRLFEDKLKLAQVQQLEMLSVARASSQESLQTHRFVLQTWQEKTTEELQTYKQGLELAVLKQLHLSDIVTAGAL